MTYFITFSCYGARPHGDEDGSVDRDHNLVGSRPLEPDPTRLTAEQESMLQNPYTLDETARAVVLEAIQHHRSQRGWKLLAAHVRSTHVHAIVEAEVRPETIMTEFKSYASRALNQLATENPNRKRWSRHGSTRWLWKREEVTNAMRYVIEGQGEPMALFVAEEY